MKIFFSLVLSLVSASAFAEVERLVALQGSAFVREGNGYIEVFIKGRAVSAHSDLGVERATAIVQDGLMTDASPSLAVKNCSDGVYVVTADQGNFFPMSDGSEVYLVPTIVSFTCINE